MDDGKMLKIMSANELLDQQFAPRNVVVEGFLPAGTYLFVGDEKIGKSFFVLQLCCCAASGMPFLGMPTRKAAVLYFALEDIYERLQSRIIQMFGPQWDGADLYLTNKGNEPEIAVLDKADAFLADHPETHLIVIDTFAYIKKDIGPGYSYTVDCEEIKPYKAFTDTHNLALVIVHHTRKDQSGDNPFDWINGTKGLSGTVDGSFILYRDKSGLMLAQQCRDLIKKRYSMRFNPNCCQWEALRRIEGEFDVKPEPLLELVDQIVRESWCGSATELLDRLKEMEPNIDYLPNTLARKLNSLTSRLLGEKGIEYRNTRRAEQRQLRFTRRHSTNEGTKAAANDITVSVEAKVPLPSSEPLQSAPTDNALPKSRVRMADYDLERWEDDFPNSDDTDQRRIIENKD